MARKPQMTAAQMEQVAQEARAQGYVAQVTKNGRHIIAIKPPVWLDAMKAAIAA
jgi:hypothetical protein